MNTDIVEGKVLIPIPQMCYSNTLLEGKTALVTGGSSGIGEAIAKQLLKSGCRVIIASGREERCKAAINRLKDYGECSMVIMDICKSEQVEAGIKKAIDIYPQRKIDILVNSAGINRGADFFDITEHMWDRVLDTNLKGTFFVSQRVAAHMVEKKIKGHILNIASSSSLRNAMGPYEISKWAIRGMTLGLADRLLRHGIVVNAIAPGPTATPMLGKSGEESIENSQIIGGRYLMPEEIASLAVYMVSDLGNMIIGDTFFITGGSGTISLHR